MPTPPYKPDANAVDEKSRSSSPRINITVIATSSLAKGFSVGLISTYVSLYFVELGGDPITLGLMTAVASLLGSSMFLLGGFVADYYGRRRIIILAAFYSIFFPLLYAVVVMDWRLFAALSVVAAVGSVSNPAFHALIVDSAHPKKRTIVISSLQVFVSLPMALAPLLGGQLIQSYGLTDGFRLACVYAGAASIISAFILLFLRETLQSDLQKSSLTFKKWKDVVGFPRSLSSSLKALMLSYSLVAFANGAMGPYFILYATSVVGLTPLQWAPIASIQSLAIALKIPGGWLSDKFGKRRTMIVSVLACAPFTVLFVFSRSFLQALIAAVLLVITGMYYGPAYEALQADLTPRMMRGRIAALWQLNSGISLALGTLVGGFLFQAVAPALPFYLFTGAELVAALFLIGFVREPPNKEV